MTKTKALFLLCGLSLFSLPALEAKENCPEKFGRYGKGISYQDFSCRFFIKADTKDEKSYRNITFTNEGLIQVFSNFPGTTNSNSTGARVYYLFPLKEKKEIVSVSDNGLVVKHGSGVTFNFDKNGKVSSKDLKMKVSDDINSKNKSGVEIESYSKGLVFDLGYRMGNTPALNRNADVTVTDKNNKKCAMKNSEINDIKGDEHILKFKSNESLHKFLAKKCPQLDLSDLLKAFGDNINSIEKKVNAATKVPQKENDLDKNDQGRKKKESFDSMEELLDNLDSKKTIKK